MKLKLEFIPDSKYWIPGDSFNGKIIVTTPYELKVKKVDVSLFGRIIILMTDRYISPSVWENLDRIYYEAAESARTLCMPEMEEIQNKEELNLAPSGFYRNRDHSYSAPRNTNPNFLRYECITFTESLDLDQLLPSKRFPRGTTVLPFSVNPTEYLEQCRQSGWSYRFVRKYYAKVDISYPSSYFTLGIDAFSLKWSKEATFECLRTQLINPKIEQSVYHINYEVGYWDKESFHYGKSKKKYSRGKETATDRFPMKLKLTVPSLVQLREDKPVYVSDIVSLKTWHDESKHIQLVPAMELTSLKVFLRTVISVRTMNEFTNFDESRYMDRNNFHIGEETLGEIHDPEVDIDPETTTDLRPLLRGFKFPSDPLSSCMRPQFPIYNYLCVVITVRVRSDETDGTPQKAEDVEISGLINLQRVLHNPFHD